MLGDRDENNHMPTDVLRNALYFSGTRELSKFLGDENMRSWDAVKRETHPHLISKWSELYKRYELD